MRLLIQKNPLYFAFLLPALVDAVLTLLGQGESYWSSSKIVNEASPAYYFLIVSPGIYSLGVIFWFIVWYFVFKYIKEPLNLILMFLFICGHSWGAGSWLMRLMRENGVFTLNNQPSIILGWMILMIYFLIVAIWVTYCIKIYFKR